MATIGITLEVDDKGSVVVKNFTDKTVTKVKQMSDKSIGHVQKLSAKFTDGLGGAISKVGKGLMSLKTLAVGALAGWGVKELAAGFLNTGAAMDSMRISLDTITKGSGEEWFRKLNEWALKMPVNTEKAIQSFIMMRAMGLQPTIDQMTVLVDTMSALGGQADTMNGIARALGQIQTKGKVSAEELMQLAERGVPVFEILREKFGDVETSSLDAKKAIAAIFEGLEARFGGQSEKIQNKWAGLVETLKSYWTDFKRMVMDAGVMAYIESGLKNLADKIDELKKSGALREWAEKTGSKIIEIIKKTVTAGKDLYNWSTKNYEKMKNMAGVAKKIAVELTKFYVISKIIAGLTAVITFFKGMTLATAALAAKTVLLSKAMKSNLLVLAGYGAYKAGEFLSNWQTGIGQTKKDIEEWTGTLARLKAKLLAAQAEAQSGLQSGVGGSSVVDDIRQKNEEIVNIAKATAKEQVAAMIAVAGADKTLLTVRLSEYRKFYSSLQSKITETANIEKRYIQELNALYKQKADIQKSAEQMIRGLRESAMSPMERYESQSSALDKQYFDAMRMSGQEQVNALEEYKQAVASFASGFRGGVMETSTQFGIESSQIIDSAVSNIERATAAQQRALESMADEKEKQIKANEIWGDSLTSTARDVAGEIETLQDIISGLSGQIEAMQKIIEIEGINDVSPVIDRIQRELNDLHDKTITITTIHRSMTASGGGDEASAPVSGSYQHGTNYVPKTGIYQLHQGEKVIPRSQAAKQIKTGDIIINIPESASPQTPEDWRYIAREFIKPELGAINA